ncbi:MAG: glycosyltransferase family 39 protein [Chloroflexota bacterium]
MRSPLAGLLLVTLIGAIWRVAALLYNVWPHGDVAIDAAISQNIASGNGLMVPFVDVRYYPTEQFGFGYPLDQHPPIWPLVGGAFARVVGDAYLGLRFASLVAGITCIPLSYLAFRRLLGPGWALFTATLVGLSYPLVDYSGNGSLWSLLTAGYLACLWLYGAGAGLSRRRWAGLGIAAGLSCLTNYPALVIPAALLAAAGLARPQARQSQPGGVGFALAGAALALVTLPWLTYNVYHFGNPLWSQPLQRQLLGAGSRDVEYLVTTEGVIKRNVPASGGLAGSVRARAVDVYGNVGFVTRQLLILAPGISVAFAATVMLWLLLLRGGAARRPDIQALTPVICLALAHLGLILTWPTAKFRYLIPLMPLVFGCAAWMLQQLGPRQPRMALAGCALAACAFTNVWTFVAIPSHTYYYNGGLVADNFGGQGEAAFVDEARRFQNAAAAISARGQGTILADHLLHSFTGYPLVVNSTSYPPDVIAHLVKTYQIRYVVAPRRLSDSYAPFGAREIWHDELFAAWELEPRPAR